MRERVCVKPEGGVECRLRARRMRRRRPSAHPAGGDAAARDALAMLDFVVRYRTLVGELGTEALCRCGFCRSRSGAGIPPNLITTMNDRELSASNPKRLVLLLTLGVLLASTRADANLVQDPGFEESSNQPSVSRWTPCADSQAKPAINDREAHAGRQSLAIPAHSAVEQTATGLPAGIYLARVWVKSKADQYVTFLLEDQGRPWAAYTCAELKTPKEQWTLLETSCVLNQPGNLRVTFGGMSREFRAYHGTLQEMKAPILADDFELVRFEPPTAPHVALWDARLQSDAALDWTASNQWAVVQQPNHTFAGAPVFQSRHLVGTVRKSDGGLVIYAIHGRGLTPRGVLVPVPAFTPAGYTSVEAAGRKGVQVASADGAHHYVAWFSPTGLISLEPQTTTRFELQGCRMRYGLLPSFTGADLCYAPGNMPAGAQFNLPSTRWLVGLLDGGESMLVAAWPSSGQAASLGLSGAGDKRMIDSLSVDTQKGGLTVSFVEHPGIWHEEPLLEDWLEEYTPVAWQRPFPARWLGEFFVTSGGEPSFRRPQMDYAFPIANAKTRMWGVWFEDWNHYPFYFDGPRTILHFEKTFIPKGRALMYFLEPAAADLYSPCEIVTEALGQAQAAALFDWDANQLRKLKWSTPDEFMYDRPVCATTTRLSKIKRADKPTIGVNLATHLYEFVREIRGRIDQYGAWFTDLHQYLEQEQIAHPEIQGYVKPLQTLIAEAQSKSKEIYATPLPAVQAKIEAMKERLRQGKQDGFDCAELDVRSPAGSQDDLCRRYSRLVIRLTQTAAAQCGDSPVKAAVATHIWEESRQILRQPTRWEPRRTLYFFEP